MYGGRRTHINARIPSPHSLPAAFKMYKFLHYQSRATIAGSLRRAACDDATLSCAPKSVRRTTTCKRTMMVWTDATGLRTRKVRYSMRAAEYAESVGYGVLAGFEGLFRYQSTRTTRTASLKMFMFRTTRVGAEVRLIGRAALTMMLPS